MGYSIFIIAKEESLQTKMSDFLSKHLIGFNKLYFNDDDNYFRLAVGPKDISYTGDMENSLIIGFDFNASGAERTHMFEILKWMCEKIGSEKDVYYYDGEHSTFKNIPISKRIEHQANKLLQAPGNKKYSFIDLRRSVERMEIGYFSGIEKVQDAEVLKAVNLIENDIGRLDKLWNEESK